MTKRCLPDINVWFALAVEDHPHHRVCLEWWEHNAAIAGFVTLTQLGLLRLLTTREAMGGAPLSNTDAWRVFDAFAGDSRVSLFPDNPDAADHFRRLSVNHSASPKIWVDAWLAAQAMALEAEIVTCDRAFQRFEVSCRILG